MEPERTERLAGDVNKDYEPVTRTGMPLSYGSWLRPFIDENNIDPTDPDEQAKPAKQRQAGPAQESVQPERRRRGRPRVSAVRNDSAIEKRRAQVREAQRTYQKRKDNAAHSVNQRCDDLLQVLSDVSTEVEELLRVASKSGVMGHNDALGAQVRRLWDSYDVSISHPCVKPELRLLQVKNDRRRGEHMRQQTFRISHIAENQEVPSASDVTNHASSDPSNVDVCLVRGDDTTMLQSFQTATRNKLMAGRSIFELVLERQEEFKKFDKSLS